MSVNAINKELFEVTCINEEIAKNVQLEIEHYTALHINSIIDSVLTNVVGSDTHLKIDKIEIDLGDIGLSKFGDPDMLDKFKVIFTEKISDAHNYNNPESYIKPSNNVSTGVHTGSSSNKSDWELIRTLLLKGDLPWWADKNNNIKFDTILRNIINLYPGSIKSFLEEYKGRLEVMCRLNDQLKPTTKRLLNSLIPGIFQESISRKLFLDGSDDNINNHSLPHSLLAKFSSILSSNTADSIDMLRKILLRKLGKIIAVLQNKNLSFNNDLPGDDLMAIGSLRVSYNKPGLKTKENLGKLIQRLSVFQIEFLLLQVSLLSEVKISKDGFTFLLNYFANNGLDDLINYLSGVESEKVLPVTGLNDSPISNKEDGSFADKADKNIDTLVKPGNSKSADVIKPEANEPGSFADSTIKNIDTLIKPGNSKSVGVIKPEANEPGSFADNIIKNINAETKPGDSEFSDVTKAGTNEPGIINSGLESSDAINVQQNAGSGSEHRALKDILNDQVLFSDDGKGNLIPSAIKASLTTGIDKAFGESNNNVKFSIEPKKNRTPFEHLAEIFAYLINEANAFAQASNKFNDGSESSIKPLGDLNRPASELKHIKMQEKESRFLYTDDAGNDERPDNQQVMKGELGNSEPNTDKNKPFHSGNVDNAETIGDPLSPNLNRTEDDNVVKNKKDNAVLFTGINKEDSDIDTDHTSPTSKHAADGINKGSSQDENNVANLHSHDKPITDINQETSLADQSRQRKIALIMSKVNSANPVLRQHLQQLDEAGLEMLEKVFKQHILAQDSKRKVIKSIIEHPHFLKFDILKIYANSYFPTIQEIKNVSEPTGTILTKRKESLVAIFSKRHQISRSAFLFFLDKLSLKEIILLNDIFQKQTLDNSDEKRIITKILFNLSQDAVLLIKFLTELPENEIKALLPGNGTPSPGVKSGKGSSGDIMSVNTYENKLPGNFHNEEDHKIYIENAGLCLIAIYLRGLFNRLGYLENGAFKTKVIATRAFFTLHYIVTGKKKCPEYILQFNKLLCGFRMEDHIISGIRLTKKEVLESDNLLQSVIDNWKALKNTSIDGFRESFLQRKGILKESESYWTLQVERKGYDLLLNTIPWGFSIIKLPWMKKHMQVEW